AGVGFAGLGAEVHASERLPMLAPRRFALAAEGGIHLAHYALGVEVEVAGISAQEAADVEGRQVDVESVGLELLQIITADLGVLGGFADRDAFPLARLLESFADGLHEDWLGKESGYVTTKHAPDAKFAAKQVSAYG